MDSQVKKSRVQSTQDAPASDADIVRGIVEIERAYSRAYYELSEQLMVEIGAQIRSAIPEDWQAVGSSEGASITVPDWRSTRGAGRGDVWLELAEVANDELEHSWIAAATASGETRMVLELRVRNGLPAFPVILSANAGTAALLMERGFEQAEAGTRLFVPIKLDQDLLASAFENGDFGDALVPVTHAIELVVAAKGDIDGLVALLRKRGGTS